MKKVLSVILAAVMVACCVPFSVFAYDGSETLLPGVFDQTDSTQPDYKVLTSGIEYIIPSGTTVTIPATRLLYILNDAKLTVKEGGKLNVLGSIIIMDFGALYAQGIIDHGDHIKIEQDADGNEVLNADAKVQFRFPDLNDDSIKLAGKITVSIDYDGIHPSQKDIPDEGKTVDVPLNKEIRINAHIIEPDPARDKYDDALLKVKLNNIGLTYEKGQTEGVGCFTTTATTGCDISYAKWDQDVNFLTTKRIVLPTGEGYEVKPRYPDKVKMTEDGTIVVKYGDPFSFYVDVDEAYDMSNYKVYIYNGYGWLKLKDFDTESTFEISAEPDENGYYNIPGEMMTGDLTIKVAGIMKNSTINLIGNLLETFRNIFNMIKEFIEGLMQMFGTNQSEG